MNSIKNHIIAIDGPAGSGKSTVSKLLAKRLGFIYLDSGAIYRTITLACMRKKINMESQEEILNVIHQTDIRITESTIYITAENISNEIRTPEVTKNVAYIASSPAARTSIVSLEQKIVKDKNAVVEGRDTGTVVFPDATIKIFLEASSEERAKRRFEELHKKGINVDYENVKKEIERRDDSDKSRLVGPLVCAPDAIVVDTSKLSIEQVVSKLEEIVTNKI
ncbi:MAG: (d)CMP kinase [Planctomycetota bacterium]